MESNKTKGVFCISFDTELVWGRHDMEYLPEFLSRARRTRKIIKNIISLLERNKIGVTWAVVGHLFLESCNRQNGVVHSDIFRPKYEWYKKDWYAKDPATDIKINPEWYGKDIVENLKKTSYQEIGSHTFSHLIMGDNGCSKNAAETDIEKCVELAKGFNIKLQSFVFPRNKIGHLNVLRKYGFLTYRGNFTDSDTGKILFDKAIQLFELFIPLAPKVSDPLLIKGLVNIPASMYFPSGRGKRKYIPRGVRFRKAKKGIDEAIKTGKIFHMWGHPIDFADDTAKLLGDFHDIISYAIKRRDSGELLILPMRDIAQQLLQQQNAK